MLGGAGRAVQRFVLRTSDSPLRVLWRLAVEALLRLVAAIVRRGIPGAAAYATGSVGSGGEPVYGVSDLDLVIVVPDDPAGPGRNRYRVIDRWSRLSGALPVLNTVFDLGVHEDEGLRAAASDTTLTFGLDRPPGEEPSLYHGASRESRIGARGLLHP